jgi:hypothetical protein
VEAVEEQAVEASLLVEQMELQVAIVVELVVQVEMAVVGT